jgi:hypothetical protein
MSAVTRARDVMEPGRWWMCWRDLQGMVRRCRVVVHVSHSRWVSMAFADEHWRVEPKANWMALRWLSDDVSFEKEPEIDRSSNRDSVCAPGALDRSGADLDGPARPPERVVIETSGKNCGWSVSVGDKTAADLAWDEMLALVTSLTMPSPRPARNWLRERR